MAKEGQFTGADLETYLLSLPEDAPIPPDETQTHNFRDIAAGAVLARKLHQELHVPLDAAVTVAALNNNVASTATGEFRQVLA